MKQDIEPAWTLNAGRTIVTPLGKFSLTANRETWNGHWAELDDRAALVAEAPALYHHCKELIRRLSEAGYDTPEQFHAEVTLRLIEARFSA